MVPVEPAVADRVAARCPHFGSCGGCQWQDVDYHAQARAKAAIIAERLQDLGGAGAPPVRPILAADDPWYFRNKMEFSFQPPDRLGLHRQGRWDEVVDLQVCYLQSQRSVDIMRVVREFTRQHGLACYDRRTHEGFLRHLVIREGKATGEVMVALITAPGSLPQAQALVHALVTRVAGVTSILWAVNPTKSDAVEVTEVQVLHGRPFIYERLGGLTFKLGLLTFFQTNTAQAERMVDVVRQYARLTGTEQLVDLYCGVGTFALTLAGRAAQVVGVEAVPGAVEAARENAALNGIANATFAVADAVQLEHVLTPGQRPDVLVLDPPRAGAGAKVMAQIIRLAPSRVVYVSCNPATLAPDLRVLRAGGYEIVAIQPVDLFPHTPHVECVVSAQRASVS